MTEILVTGASGFIGGRVLAALAAAGHSVTGTLATHPERVPDSGGRAVTVPVDLTDDASIERAFRASWPEVVIHAAAIADLKACEVEPEKAQRVNVAATAKLAAVSASFGARFLLLSTDQVFDGARGDYGEDDAPSPIHAYGRTKLEAEQAARRAHPATTILRLGLVYGASASGERSASEQVVNLLRTGGRPRLFTDEFRSPILVDDVVAAIEEVLFDRDLPLLHLAGPERLSRHAFGVLVAEAFGLDRARIDAIRLADTELMPRRPPDLALDTRRARSRLAHPPRAAAAGLAVLAAADPGGARRPS